MEQLKWTTPIKNDNEYEHCLSKSPIIYKTPVKQCGGNSKQRTYQNNIGCLGVLPTHITPPSGLTKFIARNPFETDLTNRLHLSVISPTVFSKVSSSSQQTSDFAWSVDELALIQPAKIEEFPMQQLHCMDPEAEIKAQAAIDQFFKENQIIPSPWQLKRKENRTKIEMDSPGRTCTNVNFESPTSKKDGWCQTVLTFPSELPSHVMEILKPYFTFTQEQNAESDDANSSNNSLRRKLFFNHEDCAENEDHLSDCLSPATMNGSLVLSSSPPQSGMLVHGAALNHSPTGEPNHDKSHIISAILSPPNISPIQSTVNMSCESVRSRHRSFTRLDFTTNMSIDQSSSQHRINECSHNYSLDESHNKAEIEAAKKTTDEYLNLEYNSTCIQPDSSEKPEILKKNTTQLEHNIDSGVVELNLKHNYDGSMFKYLTDSCKMNTSESCMFQQTNTMLGISDQPSVSNSVQDTGYQTCSMSNTTNVTDSYNGTPVKHKVCKGVRILAVDDEFRLSDWKENMKNIFSSTPSRTNRERDSHIL